MLLGGECDFVDFMPGAGVTWEDDGRITADFAERVQNLEKHFRVVHVRGPMESH